MDDGGDLQQKTLSLSHAVVPLHAVKYIENVFFHVRRVGSVTFVALRHVAGRRKDILGEIVGEFYRPGLLRIFLGNAVAETDSGYPEHLGPGQL